MNIAEDKVSKGGVNAPRQLCARVRLKDRVEKQGRVRQAKLDV
jgi:hypothetical protein